MKTFQELCERYEMKKAAFSLFVKAHRDEIDPDRTHISKSGRIVNFDDFSVLKLDKLRGFKSEIENFDISKAEPEEIILLQREISELKDILLQKEKELRQKDQELAAEHQKMALLLAANNNYMAQIEGLEHLKNRLLDSSSAPDRRAGSRWKWRK